LDWILRNCWLLRYCLERLSWDFCWSRNNSSKIWTKKSS
jgi:hypothetical protein